MIDPRGLGQQRLEPAWFTTAALRLDELGAAGLVRNEARTGQRRAAAAVAPELAGSWRSPEATVTVRALADWCAGDERVEHPVAEAYQAMRELAAKARETAAVIERVERWERTWLEQLGARVGEGGVRGVLNVADALGGVTDEVAQHTRDDLDRVNHLREQASAEREAALRAWSSAVEHTAGAVARAADALRWATVVVPGELRPHRGRTPQETADALRAQWKGVPIRRVPADPAELRAAWESLRPEQRRELVRRDPARVADYLLWVVVHGTLADDPVHRELRAMVEADRSAGRPEDRAVRRLLDGAAVADGRARGLDPREYASELQAYWLDKALDRAGIDPGAWLPQDGAAANGPIIEAVYRYYGELFLAHPELQWAGMANLIGPSFAGGFHDLDSIRQLARTVAERIDQLPPVAREALPPALRDLGRLAAAGDEELGFFVATLLTMQKKIFIDQAVAHEAYLAGGLPAISELAQINLLDPQTADGWGKISRGAATGDQALIAEGNTDLLHREQWLVIKREYDQMRARPGTGEAMTYLMGAVGQPSVPGSRTYGEVLPFEVRVPTPGPARGPVGIDNPAQGTVVVETPLPDGNISQVDNRWRLIMDDTLPAYQRLLREDPAGARALVASPLADRFAANRLRARLPALLDQLTAWSVRVGQ